MSAIAEASAVEALAAPVKWQKRYPKPTTKFYKNPLRWSFNKVIELGFSIPLSHIALFAFMAMYFILFQSLHGQHALGTTLPDVKGYWDTLLSRHIRLLSQSNWDTWRHFFRNGGQALLVTLTVLFMTFNPHVHKPPKKPIHGAGQLVGRFFFAIACAVPFMIGFGYLFHGIQHWFHTGVLAPSVGAHPNIAQKLYADQWTTKVSVVLAAIVARRPMYPVYGFVQKYFATRRVLKGKKDHWYHPAPYRAMVRELSLEKAQERADNHSNSLVYLLSGGAVVVTGLAIYGWYIFTYIAH